jgi:hypothetical protein
MLVYVMKKEEINFMRDLAMAQVVIDGKSGVKAFEEYRKIVFPWAENAAKVEQDKYKEILNKAVAQGPLRITSVTKPKVSSRLISKASEEDRKVSDSFYNKLKKVNPYDKYRPKG